MKLAVRCLCWVPVTLIWLGLPGCQPTTETTRVPVNTPEIVAHRAQFQLAGEPADALPLGEIPDLLNATGPGEESTSEADASEMAAPAERDVVFVARVGGVRPSDMADDQDFPWEAGRAVFVVSDPTHEADAQHSHAGAGHDDCPFCAKKQAAGPMALVQCLDSDGEALAVDARDLFTIAENDVIVVEGTARMAGDTLIVVDAKGIYVRR